MARTKDVIRDKGAFTSKIAKDKAAKDKAAKEEKANRDAIRARNLDLAIKANERELAKKAAKRKADKAAKDAKDRAAKDKAAKDKAAKDKKKKDTKKKDAKEKTTGGNIKDSPSDTAERRSPTTYRPNVPIAKKGTDTFHGTNIPTEGYSRADIRDYNARLKADLADKNYRGANDVIFDIAFAKGGGQGNPRVGAVQSGMYRLKGKDTPLWAEGQVNSTNDRYVIRDSSGAPTGEEVRFSDQHGVVRGKANEWKSIGSWGGNARAGILEGQPTTTPPPSGILASIVDLDDPNRNVLAGPGAGKPYTGSPTYNPSQIGAGGSGEYLSTPYTRPALQDWSHLAPPTMPGLLGTAQAQQSLLANNLANYQTQAQGGVLNYSPRGGSTWAPRTYSANPLDNSAAAAAAAASSSSSSGDGYTGPLGNQLDSYHDWYMADRPSWGQAGYTTSPLGGHQAALNRQYEAYSAPLLAAGTNAESYGDWFGGPLSGGILSNLGNGQ